ELLRLDAYAVDDHIARRRREDAAEDREERRLAGAGRTFERNDLAALDREVDSFEHRDRFAAAFREMFFDAARLKNRHLAYPLKTSAGSIDATLRNEIIEAARHNAMAPKNTAIASSFGMTSLRSIL